MNPLEHRARRVADGVLRRAALHEATGVLQAWSGGDPRQARALLDEHLAPGEREVVAVVDAEALVSRDPDWRD